MTLFGSFGVSLTLRTDGLHARLVTSAIFLLNLAVGWLWSFKALEGMEQISAGVKLAIIVGMLFGLGWYFLRQSQHVGLMVSPATASGWPALTLAFGLIVTVQGFETSRYLGGTYSARTRIGSMRLVQGVSMAIYMIYIIFLPFSSRSQQTFIRKP